jgi:competence protein ComEC
MIFSNSSRSVARCEEGELTKPSRSYDAPAPLARGRGSGLVGVKDGTIVESPKAGHSFNIGTLNLKVLSPHDDDSTTSNNASIVVRVMADEVSAIFPGDCEVLRWGNILKYFEDHLPANVFLVPHHGSDDGCNEEVLKAANPEYSIVSAGEDNK